MKTEKIIQIMKDIEKFEKFHTVNEEHHLEGDFEGMKEFVADEFAGHEEYDNMIGFLGSLSDEELTTLYHQVERWMPSNHPRKMIG